MRRYLITVTLLLGSISALLFTGCNHLVKPEKPKTAISELINLVPTGFDSPLTLHPNTVITSEPDKADIALPNRTAKKSPLLHPVAASTTEDPLYKKVFSSKPLETKRVPVKLLFEKEPLSKAMKVFAGILKFQYVLSPKITGTLNLKLDTSLTQYETWLLLKNILHQNNAFLSVENGIVQILPSEKLLAKSLDLLNPNALTEATAELVHLANVNPKNMVTHVKPFLSSGGRAISFDHLNAILVIDHNEGVQKVVNLIKNLDVVSHRLWPQVSIHCKFARSRDILDELRKVLPVLGFPINTTTGGAGVRIESLDRLNVLIASAATEELLREISDWTRQLDTNLSDNSEQIFFYDVRYADATELKKMLDFILESENESESTDAGEAAVPAPPTPTSRPVTPTTPITSLEGNQLLFGERVKAFVDKARSRLVIRTTPRAYLMLNSFLRRLDAPPRQVLVQVTVVDILLSDSLQFGITNALANKWRGVNFNTTNDAGVFVSLGKTLTPQTVFSTVTAIAGKENTKVLSAPQILTLSGNEAKINVGEKVPIISQETTDPDSTKLIRTVQYQETGIILRVTPHVTAGDMVKLDLSQEVSTANATNTSQIDSPTIKNSQIETSLIIKDQETLLLGGLISNSKSNSKNGVPILGSIPLIGHLFNTTSNRMTQRELLLLITVRIVDNKTNLRKVVERYKKAVKEVQSGLGRE